MIFQTITPIFALLRLAIAGGFVPPAEWCLPTAHLKELSGCIAMTDKEDECAGKENDDAKLDCFCTQDMLTSYYECEADVQICLESHMFDSQFESRVRRWHELCDDRLTTTMSTPGMPTLTATYDFGACSRLHKSCLSVDYETNLCARTYPMTGVEYTSCTCQPPIYSLVSECQYNGNVSCKRTTADETNIWGYSYCSSFWSDTKTLQPTVLTDVDTSTAAPTQTLGTGEHGDRSATPGERVAYLAGKTTLDVVFTTSTSTPFANGEL